MNKENLFLKNVFILLIVVFFHIENLIGNDAINKDCAFDKIPSNIKDWMEESIRKSKNKTPLPKELFFTKDSATIIGYIEGYSSALGYKTISIKADNDIRKEKIVVVSEIDSNGCFSCKFPLSYPKEVFLSINEKFINIYFEPGRTLTISFNAKEFENIENLRGTRSLAKYIYFGGPLAKKNYDLFSFDLKTLGYYHYWIIDTCSPKVYQSMIENILSENEYIVKNTLERDTISPEIVEMQKNKALLMNAFYLLDYASVKSEKGVPLPLSFYSMLQQMPLNNTSILTSNYAAFINRFEYNPELLKVYKINKISNSSFYESEINLNLWHAKDSILKHDLNLSSSFAYETTKIRDLSIVIKKMNKNEAYAYYSKLQESITSPYLRDEGLDIIINNFGKEDLGKYNTDNKVQLTNINQNPRKRHAQQLSNTKDAQIFSNMIAPFKGKYLFVEFWGTSCGPCRWNIESMKNTRTKYNNNKFFDFVFITTQQWSRNKADYEKYIKDQELKNTLFISNDDFNYMQQLFQFHGVPHCLFIDPDGNVLDSDFELIFHFEEARKWIMKE